MITPSDYSYFDLQRLYLEASELKNNESRGSFLREACRMNASVLRAVNIMFETAAARSTRSVELELDR
jgi:hypothetical protein